MATQFINDVTAIRKSSEKVFLEQVEECGMIKTF